MLELYWAYADYRDLMELTEELIVALTDVVHAGSKQVVYQGREYNLARPFARVTMADAILDANDGLDATRLRDVEYLRQWCTRIGAKFDKSDGAGKLQTIIFEHTVEHTLLDPTFIFGYPAEVSPLSRANDADPFLTDRFEFFISGREIANGFSELNDAEDQAARFQAQVERKDAGDDEAMFYDADYIRALEYGMPPTAGLGIGVDRLVMFITDQAAIRDVLLFPQVRPESGA
jgi:lysyl-tRNA synthetase class 2